MSNETLFDPHTTVFARIITDAMAAHESNFDHAACAEARAEDAERNKGHLHAGIIDFTEFYRLSLEDAARQAAESLGAPYLWYPAYLLMHAGWNEVYEWAENPAECMNVDLPPANDELKSEDKE